ncbi:MAG: hypothetical protein LKG79_09685 [Furfurilactobacillus sp.]|jgi:Ca2+/Na+ antiporter|uniref:DUF3188 domain-containing protein n=1 Tax=Furfurilactobacillus milii TaxID=2888272 RepID=A0ABT6DDU6_9LACO|nr:MULTISPECIES: hypothetical protein [Furfurilactobacillus]QLE67382.1 hypothetical protein LROSL2_2032 [Furfurilactobacillus rossiae]MCF6161537.1 hypothetical protein [Furfurilactobacillus milii]MCF6163917.1 hypothetical protein [Furfurilactobacillus milii]MCF6419438.1 hypothetical protein [Furfurilactobacillus milii]MCH4011571.1 hypothetical protein [Furfurilactobacillus sp.]
MSKTLRDALSFLAGGIFLLAFGIWDKQLASGAFGFVLLLIGLYNLYSYWHERQNKDK